jgi:hypothetical protein
MYFLFERAPRHMGGGCGGMEGHEWFGATAIIFVESQTFTLLPSSPCNYFFFYRPMSSKFAIFCFQVFKKREALRLNRRERGACCR